VQETLTRGHIHNMEVDGIILDMTSLQLSMHVTDTTYFTATFASLLSFVQGLPSSDASSSSSSSSSGTLKPSSSPTGASSSVSGGAPVVSPTPAAAAPAAAAAVTSPTSSSTQPTMASLVGALSPSKGGLANAVRTMRAVAVAASQWKLTKTAMLSLKSIFKHWKLALTKFGKKTQAQLAMLNGIIIIDCQPCLSSFHVTGI
jgi:hypothetical protein